jgi:hypothetical protein
MLYTITETVEIDVEAERATQALDAYLAEVSVAIKTPIKDVRVVERTVRDATGKLVEGGDW